MATKNVTQVLIGGKIYTLGGYESEEYLQRVAAYLNGKITEVKGLEGYSRLSSETKGLLLNLNTADDYFKMKRKAEELSAQLSAKDKELYEIKHELISAQMKLESTEKTLSSVQDDQKEAQKRIVQLETQLAGRSQK